MSKLFQSHRQALNDLEIILKDSPTIKEEKRSSPLTSLGSRAAGCLWNLPGTNLPPGMGVLFC